MDIKSAIMGFVFALIWSSAFTSARIIVQVAPPLSISALRFLIAGLIAVSIAYFLGQRAKFTHKQWFGIILFWFMPKCNLFRVFFHGHDKN